MGLIRLLSWLVVGYFLWAMVRNYLRKQQNLQGQRSRQNPKTPALIVKCRQCGLHLPEPEAISDQYDWFCNDDHRRLWQQRGN